MPELAKPDLEQLIPELLDAFSSNDVPPPHSSSSAIRCRVETCPDLSDAPFHLNVPHLGQLIYIVPDSICPEEAIKQIQGAQVLATRNNFHIVSDCRAGPVLHLILPNAADQNGGMLVEWRHRCRRVFARQLGDQWEMAFAERVAYAADNQTTTAKTRLGLLRASQPDDEAENVSAAAKMPTVVDVWLAPVNRRIVAGCTKKVKKKVVRKVLRRSSREEQQPPAVNGNGSNNDDNKTAPENGLNSKKQQNGTAAAKPLKTTTTAHDLSHLNGTLPNGKNRQQQNSGTTTADKASINIVGRIANLFNGMGSGNNNNGKTMPATTASARGRSQSLEEQQQEAAPTMGGRMGIGIADSSSKLKRANSECNTPERNGGGQNAKESTLPAPIAAEEEEEINEKMEKQQPLLKPSPPRTPPKPLCVRIPVQQLSGGATFATSPANRKQPTMECNGGEKEEGQLDAANANDDLRKKEEEGGTASGQSEEEGKQFERNVPPPISPTSHPSSPTTLNSFPAPPPPPPTQIPSTCAMATNRPAIGTAAATMAQQQSGTNTVTEEQIPNSKTSSAQSPAAVSPLPPSLSNHQSPTSPPSAESGRGRSESPSSFHSTISDSPSLLARMPRNGFHREDAPSPSTSLIQSYIGAATANGTTGNGTRRPFPAGGIAISSANAASFTNGANGTSSLHLLNGHGSGIGLSMLSSGGGIGTNRLGPPSLGSVLSPISSCGSVEAQQEAELTALLMEQQREAVDGANDEGGGGGMDAEDESTLMLLNHQRERGELSTLGADDADELSCSLRDDFSMASMCQQQRATTTTTGCGGGGGIGSNHVLQHHKMRTAIRDGGGRGGGGGTATDFGTSRANAHTAAAVVASAAGHAHSPSPSKQGVSVSPAPAPMVRGMFGTFRMSVPVLQQILSLFSYKELGELRRVHPHWDELCGQQLNAAYSQLVARAQWLLTDCQRRVHREPALAQPIKLLTRVHVHVLNPVDGMRAFMDEGVLCFSYGALLDRAFAMLARVEEMIGRAATSSSETDEHQEQEEEEKYNEASTQLDQLAELARRAAHHYKQWVEPEAEKRMSELYRASAQQRLQRLDSFLVEHNVTRVERESEKHRDELRWELEQLKHQSQQLKKENRELKQLCLKMDQRVEVLERKFRTMARLLQ